MRCKSRKMLRLLPLFASAVTVCSDLMNTSTFASDAVGGVLGNATAAKALDEQRRQEVYRQNEARESIERDKHQKLNVAVAKMQQASHRMGDVERVRIEREQAHARLDAEWKERKNGLVPASEAMFLAEAEYYRKKADLCTTFEESTPKQVFLNQAAIANQKAKDCRLREQLINQRFQELREQKKAYAPDTEELYRFLYSSYTEMADLYPKESKESVEYIRRAAEQKALADKKAEERRR